MGGGITKFSTGFGGARGETEGLSSISSSMCRLHSTAFEIPNALWRNGSGNCSHLLNAFSHSPFHDEMCMRIAFVSRLNGIYHRSDMGMILICAWKMFPKTIFSHVQRLCFMFVKEKHGKVSSAINFRWFSETFYHFDAHVSSLALSLCHPIVIHANFRNEIILLKSTTLFGKCHTRRSSTSWLRHLWLKGKLCSLREWARDNGGSLIEKIESLGIVAWVGGWWGCVGRVEGVVYIWCSLEGHSPP